MTEDLVEREPTKLSPTGWEPKGELSFREWIAAGRRLGTIGRASQWWIGDWLNYGASRYGEKYDEAVAVTGYDPGTLRILSYVAGRIEVLRRRNDLSWGHHREVAALEPAGQDQWLERAGKAGEDGWSVHRLREEMRKAAKEALSTGPSPSRSTGEKGAGGGELVEAHTVTLVLRREAEREQIADAVERLVADARELEFDVVAQRIV